MLNLARNVPAIRSAWRFADECEPPPGAAASAGTHVWPLRPAWEPVVREALALGAAEVTIGDGLCGLVQQGRVPWCGPDAALPCTPQRGLVGADLRAWACGVVSQSRLPDGGWRRGLRFYDGQGHTTLRIDLDESLPGDAFHGFVRRHAIGMPPQPRAAAYLRAVEAVQWADGQHVAPRQAQASRALLALFDPERQAAVLARHAGAGLAVPLADEALVEALRLAVPSGMQLQVNAWHRGAWIGWTGSVEPPWCAGGRVVLQAGGMRAHWHEDIPGQQVWLWRHPGPLALSHSLLLFGPGGDLRLGLSAAPTRSGREPCAWRAAIETLSDMPTGRAC